MAEQVLLTLCEPSLTRQSWRDYHLTTTAVAFSLVMTSVGGGTWYKTPRRVGSADLWLPAA
jgi:hypothetical protein